MLATKDITEGHLSETRNCPPQNIIILALQSRSSYLKKDIGKLERIKKIIPELRDLSYESPLLECSLTTLETWRLRGDQIEVFKIANGYEDVDRNMFFKLKRQ